mgnify:CR=1 FL=1
MKIVIALLAGLLAVEMAFAWNLGAKRVNAMEFKRSGEVRFTLFDSGSSGDEFMCGTGRRGQWFEIEACSSNDSQCLSATNRMSSMLLSAKLAAKKVHIHRAACVVSGVALKP